MWIRAISCVISICLSLLTTQDALSAAEVSIVHGPQAPALERYAAQELGKLLERAFRDVQPQISSQSAGKVVVLVGSPLTNPSIGARFGDWPEVTDQGIVIRSSADGQQLLVGGGSPVATLWAVYELGEHLGFRFLPRGDLAPLTRRPLDLSGLNIVREPVLRSRTWRTINDFAIGPESWGLEEHQRFLKQLAKLKYNRVMLSVYPWQPFVEYEFQGIRKTTALHWFGEVYPVDSETVGKKAFLGAERFENPDFAGLETSVERHAAGRRHLQGIIDAAHQLGMTVGVSISPLEFPREFQQVLPGSKVAKGLKNLTITPDAAQGPTDDVLQQLVATRIRAYLQTYPKLDTLYLTMPEFPEWDQHAEQALKLLQQHGAPAGLTVDSLVKEATDRQSTISGQRGARTVRGHLVGLAFFRELLSDDKLLQRPDGQKVELVLTQIDPALFPVLDGVIPPQTATLHFVDYTARRVAAQRELLARVPAGKVPSRLIMTLADDNVGVLPQSALQSLSALASDIQRLGWDGFSTRYWVPAELDSSVYFLSQVSWQEGLTAEASLKELWTTATGNEAAADRLWLAWQHLERATNRIDENDLGFSFPVPGMLMRHYQAEPMPEWWQEVTDSYTQYMVELYRAHGAIDGDSKPVLFYYAKRGEYVVYYLAAVKAVREAALARKSGDLETALEHLETALESTFDAINALADVARDQSDRGLIAVLNAYAYRPLLAEYERLADEADQ